MEHLQAISLPKTHEKNMIVLKTMHECQQCLLAKYIYPLISFSTNFVKGLYTPNCFLWTASLRIQVVNICYLTGHHCHLAIQMAMSSFRRWRSIQGGRWSAIIQIQLHFTRDQKIGRNHLLLNMSVGRRFTDGIFI